MINTGGVTMWFIGLPSSGKSTIADAVAESLRAKILEVQRLDEDIIKKTSGRNSASASRTEMKKLGE